MVQNQNHLYWPRRCTRKCTFICRITDMLNVDICTDVAYHVHLMLISHLSDQEVEGMPACRCSEQGCQRADYSWSHSTGYSFSLFGNKTRCLLEETLVSLQSFMWIPNPAIFHWESNHLLF